MRLVKRAAILVGLAGVGLASVALATASTASAHDRWDKHGWKHRHHHHHYDQPGWRGPVVYERPVYYRDVPAYPYYQPGPPALNLTIPLR